MTLEQFDDMLDKLRVAVNEAIDTAHNGFASLKSQQLKCVQAQGLIEGEYDQMAKQPDMRLVIRDSYVADDKDPVEVGVYVYPNDLKALGPQLCDVLQRRKDEITGQLKDIEDTWQNRFKDFTGKFY